MNFEINLIVCVIAVIIAKCFGQGKLPQEWKMLVEEFGDETMVLFGQANLSDGHLLNVARLEMQPGKNFTHLQPGKCSICYKDWPLTTELVSVLEKIDLNKSQWQALFDLEHLHDHDLQSDTRDQFILFNRYAKARARGEVKQGQTNLESNAWKRLVKEFGNKMMVLIGAANLTDKHLKFVAVDKMDDYDELHNREPMFPIKDDIIPKLTVEQLKRERPELKSVLDKIELKRSQWEALYFLDFQAREQFVLFNQYAKARCSLQLQFGFLCDGGFFDVPQKRKNDEPEKPKNDEPENPIDEPDNPKNHVPEKPIDEPEDPKNHVPEKQKNDEPEKSKNDEPEKPIDEPENPINHVPESFENDEPENPKNVTGAARCANLAVTVMMAPLAVWYFV